MGNEEPEVERLADRLGLATEYVDARGRQVAVPSKTLRALVDALSGNDATAAPAFQTKARTPQQAYQGRDTSARYWLLAVQLYGVKSRRNWGHGDFTDLKHLLEVASRLGAAGIGLNPLHVLLHDSEFDVSPYSPSSRLFLNALYIDVEALPEFGSIRAGDLLPRAQSLRELAQVDYAAVHELKERALRRCFEHFRASEEDADFAEFRAERGDALRKFAAFEASRRAGAPSPSGDEPEADLEFHEYVQWRADRQLRACSDKARELGLGVGLYMDLAVGVRADGADAHAEADSYLHGISVGAPPDLLNVKGQDWGLTTFSPVALARQDFAPFRRMLAANMRYAGALRLDHVLWLNRLYLVPAGMPPAEGSYVRYPLQELLAALAEESDEHRCIVIGEDLGTVPPELRAELRRWGVWTYHVVQFERDESGQFKSAEEYQERALATFSTHDLPPFAAWYAGSDLAEKRAIGIDPGETEDERGRAREFLEAALGRGGKRGEIRFPDVAAFLAQTPSRMVVIGIEDALGLQQMVNVPGTIAERPNWRLRLPVDLEELDSDPRLVELADVFAAAGRAGRAGKKKGRPGS